MAVSAFVDSVALTTIAGAQTHSPGALTFKPNGWLLSGNLHSADGDEIHATYFMGAAASAADERYQAFESEDGSTSSDVGHVGLANGCMTGLLINNAVDYVGELTSFNEGPFGVTWNVSNPPGVASILNMLLLGGDITIETFVHNLGSGTGNKSLSTLSGRPSGVYFFVALGLTAGDTVAAQSGNGTAMSGWMCADGTQACCGSRHTDAQATGVTARWQRTDKCFSFRSVSALQAEGEFVSMDANGYTINQTDATVANVRLYGVAIYGGRCTSVAFNSTADSNNFDVTTAGVNPKAVILQTFGMAADTATQDHGTRSLGMSDGTRQWAIAYDDRHGADPTIAGSWLSRSHCLLTILAEDPLPTLSDSWTIVSLGSQKFTLNRDTVSAGTIQGIGLAIGDSADVVSFATPWVE